MGGIGFAFGSVNLIAGGAGNGAGCFSCLTTNGLGDDVFGRSDNVLLCIGEPNENDAQK